MSLTSLAGKTAVITGANSGIGYALTQLLVAQGAHVVMACRDLDRGRHSLESLQKGHPGAKLTLMHVDLADLETVRRFAQDCERDFPCIDLLVNNAAVMAPPFGLTLQGFELQMGVNHLGHFALDGLLMPMMLRAVHPHVVVVSSQAAVECRLDLGDLEGTRQNYDAVLAYRRSKRAQALFACELSRRVDAASFTVTAADPGYSRTDLQRHVPDLLRRIHARYTRWRYAHPARDGAQRVLRAITDPQAENGMYFSELGLAPVRMDTAFPDTAEGLQLWQQSEQVTGIHFKF